MKNCPGKAQQKICRSREESRGEEKNTTPFLFCHSSIGGRTHSQAERCTNHHCSANLCDVHTEHWVCLAHCPYWVVVFLYFLLRFSVVLQIFCCAFPGQFLLLFPLQNLNSSISFYVTNGLLLSGTVLMPRIKHKTRQVKEQRIYEQKGLGPDMSRDRILKSPLFGRYFLTHPSR